MAEDTNLLLGLIGDTIATSSAPTLHRLAGVQQGVSVRYDLLVPKELGRDFEGVFDHCRTSGYRGINVTYPYKEQVTSRVKVDDPLVRGMGACNTVIFQPDGPHGYNTDFSGFIAAYEQVRGAALAGTVLMIGAGGVGRAVAFGLARLGMTELRLVDRDIAKAESLAEALRKAAPHVRVALGREATELAAGAAGLINCTPVGMVGKPGSTLPRAAMAGAAWAFDAVYTPVDTQFLTDAAAEGLTILSGWELFFYQGVHAWAHFAELPLDEVALRAELLALRSN